MSLILLNQVEKSQCIQQMFEAWELAHGLRSSLASAALSPLAYSSHPPPVCPPPQRSRGDQENMLRSLDCPSQE